MNEQKSAIELSILLSKKLKKFNDMALGSNSLVIKESIESLSSKEYEVLYLTSLGLKSKHIALFYNLSYKTVDDYIYRAKTKFLFTGHKKDFCEYLVEEAGIHRTLPVQLLFNRNKLKELLLDFGLKRF